MPRDRYYRQTLGTLGVAVKKARILLVGAGGIGCELLKNLVLSGFGEIHIVDLDTIDLSNLNRQFLFRHEHIKKSKAIIAKETASQFNPDVRIEAHHANIKDDQFDVEWYRSFNLVFNALDNLEARRHVNRMCLLANVVLVESGTTGFNGQVQTIKKGLSECYDCNEKETPKTYPVCTIRSTPSQPIHCIVWAKSYLFAEIFGQSEEAVDDMDHSEDSDNVAEIKKLKEESEELSRLRGSMSSPDFAQQVFEKIFTQDIKRLQEMEDAWKARSPPEVLDFDELRTEAEKLGSSTRQQDQRPWTKAESFQVFCESIEDLGKRYQEAQPTTPNGAHFSFDKDDEDMLDFVAAAANLRCAAFSIDSKSKFDIKQMAGNIIPAIATTNAMTAGLCVLEAFKALRPKTHWVKAKQIFLETGPARAMTSESLKPPNPKCTVCSQASATVSVDPERATVKDLVEDVLEKQLEYNDGVTLRNESTVLYDPDFDDNLTKTFSSLGLNNKSLLTVVDERPEHPRVDLSLVLVEKEIPETDTPIQITDKPANIAEKSVDEAPVTLNVANGTAAASHEAADKDSEPDLKRKRSAEEDANANIVEKAVKKGKTEETLNGHDEAALVVEDAGDGVIVLGDD